jgi:hypothetical protein
LVAQKVMYFKMEGVSYLVTLILLIETEYVRDAIMQTASNATVLLFHPVENVIVLSILKIQTVLENAELHTMLQVLLQLEISANHVELIATFAQII